MAGLIFGLVNMADKEAQRLAIAVFVLKQSISGVAIFGMLEEVEQLVKEGNAGNLIR